MLAAGKAIVLLLLVAYVSSSWALSIQREPVPVTNRNSGPRYDIDEVERTKLTEQPAGGSSSSSSTTNNNQDGRPEETSPEMPSPVVPIGRMSIRRIFLVPVMNPWGAGHQQDHHGQESNGQAMEAPQQPQDHQQHLNHQKQSAANELEHPFLSRPFWPFMTPIRAPPVNPHRHLFGSDEASRSPSQGEREGSDAMTPSGSSNKDTDDNEPPNQAAAQPIFDPIQMMIDMMHQALNSQLEHHQQQPAPATPNFHDLANEAQSIPRPGLDRLQPDGGDSARPDQATAMRPFRPPTSQNETKEDIVEIDGKKFLRKTVINRHVGENIVFMTKRLIFTPLNETTDTMTTTTTTTTTMTPPSSERPTDGSPDADDNEGRAQEMPVRPTSEPARPATDTTPTTMEPTSKPSTPSTIVTNDDKSEQPTGGSEALPASPSTTTTTTSTGSPAEEMTTRAEGSAWVERVSDAIEKAAERIVEKAEAKLNSASTTSTTPSPSAN